jgi:hypothetical protein
MIHRKCVAIDCPRKPDTATGRCDLHDAIVMIEESRDLLMKALSSLDRIVREERGCHDR